MVDHAPLNQARLRLVADNHLVKCIVGKAACHHSGLVVKEVVQVPPLYEERFGRDDVGLLAYSC